MAKKIIKSHGITFIRIGECKRCGACGCIKWNCVHMSYDKEGKVVCDVHDRLEEVCKICSKAKGKEVTHKGCKEFPVSPQQRVVREGICGYKFIKK